MASLLALLSHPSEILGVDEGVTSQSIIFIIDEFDMFAAHPRQTLLYNLFDVAQSRKAPIAVLGCTTRLNVVELLEKRVKSRFSHRYVYLTQPKSLPAFWQVCKQGLLVERKDAEREGIDMNLDGYGEFQKYWNSKIDVSAFFVLCLTILTGMQARVCLTYHRTSTNNARSKSFCSITITQASPPRRFSTTGYNPWRRCHQRTSRSMCQLWIQKSPL